jgi:hypothetical protein
MFKELTEELLDLTVEEKGFRNALYAAANPGGACSACCTCCNCLFLC